MNAYLHDQVVGILEMDAMVFSENFTTALA